MVDDLKKTGPADDIRININQPHELRDWANALGCTEAEVVEAVKAVGVMVTDVRRYLAAKKLK